MAIILLVVVGKGLLVALLLCILLVLIAVAYHVSSQSQY